MANVKATVILYKKDSVYSFAEIITHEDYEEQVEARAKEIYADPQEFRDYLNDNYTMDEVFDFSEEDKKKIKEEDFKDQCALWARDELSDEYECIELETEVEISTVCPYRQ